MPADNLTAEFLHECFSYYPDFGWLIWKTRPLHHFGRAQDAKTWNARWAGKEAGRIHYKVGYREVMVNRHLYRAHHLIWLLETGDWPEDQIDHINHIRHDNRRKNLREATHRENSKNQKLPSNNTSGRMGVRWHKCTGKWTAEIGHGSTYRHLGLFPTFYEALLARWGAEKELDYHENHGRR